MSASARHAELGLGIVGLGGAAVNMLPSFRRSPHFRITAAADSDGAVLGRFGHDHAEAKTYSDVEHLCADADVDLVYIGTPNDVHSTHALMALAHGKHVLIEKPMGVPCPTSVKRWFCSGVSMGTSLIQPLFGIFPRRPDTIPWLESYV